MCLIMTRIYTFSQTHQTNDGARTSGRKARAPSAPNDSPWTAHDPPNNISVAHTIESRNPTSKIPAKAAFLEMKGLIIDQMQKNFKTNIFETN